MFKLIMKARAYNEWATDFLVDNGTLRICFVLIFLMCLAHWKNLKEAFFLVLAIQGIG